MLVLKDSQRSDLTLVLITLIWGTTFSVTKLGLAYVPPLTFIAIRFLMAFACLLALTIRRRPAVTAKSLAVGGFVGLIYATGFATQTVGIRLTTASKAAFITGLSVILVPVLSSLILKRRPGRLAMLGTLLAFLGLTILSVDRSLTYLLSLGDLLVLLCTVFFALHIIYVGKWARDFDPVLFATVQVGACGLASGVLAITLEAAPTQIPAAVWGGLGYLAVFATLGTTLMQVWAQRFTNPTRTAIIFTLEPVFAAVFAFFLLGEVPGWKTLAGGLLIITGIVLAELPSTAASPDTPLTLPESPLVVASSASEEKVEIL